VICTPGPDTALTIRNSIVGGQAIHQPVAKIIPNARLVWLDDVAHLPHLEGDRKTLDEIASFVDAIP
jgi:pimeloyl-ACP methyl ester carboxylesterase